MAKRMLGFCAAAAFMGLAAMASDNIAVKSGEKIAFLGDSITQFGAGNQGGYVHLVISGLKSNGVDATAIPAGISGHKSNDMLARLQRDVLDKKPDWMTMSCGVNDVWHGANGVPLEAYKKNIAALLDQCQAANVKVVVLTSTMIGEDTPNGNNQKLAAYNEFLREQAKERKLPLADLNAEMQEAVKQAVAAGVKGNALTCDGCHMGPLGNQMMALGVLKAFGLNPAELAKAKEAWRNTPAACWGVTVPGTLTMGQYTQLCDKAAKAGKPVKAVLDEAFANGVAQMLKDNN